MECKFSPVWLKLAVNVLVYGGFLTFTFYAVYGIVEDYLEGNTEFEMIQDPIDIKDNPAILFYIPNYSNAAFGADFTLDFSNRNDEVEAYQKMPNLKYIYHDRKLNISGQPYGATGYIKKENVIEITKLQIAKGNVQAFIISPLKVSLVEKWIKCDIKFTDKGLDWGKLGSSNIHMFFMSPLSAYGRIFGEVDGHYPDGHNEEHGLFRDQIGLVWICQSSLDALNFSSLRLSYILKFFPLK